MVFEKIKELLANQLDADESLMSMETNIASDLGADSLDVVELLSEIEDEFDIEIPDEDIETIKTIGDLVEYIQNNA
ncbi:MAG: acyl carrier protein [Clostridia bacterium]|nr:acyl carrier protein [Clostridia bacterium]MBR6509394.1 acyl carrier protein [Clostridia bacterium]